MSSLARGSGITIDPAAFDAVIFDMDGVVTDTAKTHAIAWKTMFDEYLGERTDRTGERFESFDIESDYLSYVDGRPRCDGANAFLMSRGIELPWGEHGDSTDLETVYGVSRRKNRAFLESLETFGVEAYDTTIELIQSLRSTGIRTAVISASENCGVVLDAAGVHGAFDARVDGLVAKEMGLKGKPDPAIFLEAARRLDVAPARAVVVEDAQAGVAAGKAGGFGLVIGVDRAGQAEKLREHGADVVVEDLAQVTVSAERRISDLPSAMDSKDAILRSIGEAIPVLFLDYDGTLTPIVERPEDALMSASMREVVRRLVGVSPLAMISGRDVAFVLEQVAVDGVLYAGSHGFDIVGPAEYAISGGLSERFSAFLPPLADAECALAAGLGGIPGAQIERKKYSIAVHYRQVAAEDVPIVERVVDEAIAASTGLRNIDWDKGRAVLWLLDAFRKKQPAFPIYIGDDLTDEDAFAALAGIGLGIVVGKGERTTRAAYSLADTDEVGEFLRWVADEMEGRA